MKKDENLPPIFSTWPRFYAFVLVLHVVVIAALRFFTVRYS